jgi:hypothetical protein
MGAGASCAICRRTILAGERVHGFVEDGAERPVCELCVTRAEGLGWRRAGEAGLEQREHGKEGRRLARLLSRRRRRGEPAPAPSSEADAEDLEQELEEQEKAPPPPRRTPAPRLDADAPSPFERAVARFNSSEAGHTVAGLTRTLGKPQASVGAAAGAPDEVRVTVAWELSWYQWGVDIGDELRPVFELDKGREIEQLDAPARQWNAKVGADGRLALAGEPAAKR